MQWFHFEDPRLDDAVEWMKRLGVTAPAHRPQLGDSFRPAGIDWFDRQMEALAEFDTTVTFCFTPEHRGDRAAPHQPAARTRMYFADFCARMIERYAPRAAPAGAAE
jgi:beta-xylosidase